MIRPSPELLAVARRWYATLSARKTDFLHNFLAEDEAVGFIGSAEGETWFGPAVRQAVGAHFKEVPEITRSEEVLARAFEHGDTGWAFFTHRFWFSTRPDAITFHTTLIFILEKGSWKIAHRHAAVPSPNVETTGHEHAAIQALIEAAQQGFSLDQREGFASIMFTDIVNSSGLAAAMGDRLWSAEIARHFGTLRDIIEGGGGQFVKSLGDGTMSSFQTPDQALQAAQSILRTIAQSDGPAISLRIGIHSGDVVQSEDDFFGTVVNKAARIADATAPGEIRISDATRAMVGNGRGFAFSDSVRLLLRGLEGEHLLHRLEWQS